MTFSGVNDGTPVSYNLPSLGVDADVKSTFPVGNEVYLFGLYPGDTDLWTLSNTSASMTFIGKEDVMVAPELLVKRSDVESGVYRELAFSHLLTCLEVKLKAKTSDAITSTGSIKPIRLVADASGSGKIKDRLTFTPAATTNTDAVSFAESAALTSLPFYKASTASGVTDYTDETYTNQSYVLTTSAALQAYSMVAPIVADAANENGYFLAIERGDGDVDYVGFDLLQSDNLTPFAGSTAGYSFSVVLTYSQEYIESIQAVVTGTIGSQDWTSG